MSMSEVVVQVEQWMRLSWRAGLERQKCFLGMMLAWPSACDNKPASASAWQWPCGGIKHSFSIGALPGKLPAALTEASLVPYTFRSSRFPMSLPFQ